MRTARALAVAACLVLAVGCTQTSDDPSDRSTKQAQTASPKQTGPISVKITPADGTQEVAPNKPVQVTVSGGEVVSVEVKGKGNVTGETLSDGTSWKSAGTLHPASSYRVKVRAKNEGGDKSTTAKFTTMPVSNTVKASVAPLDGSVVGIGQPVAVYLSQPVKNRAAVERALEVKTDKKIEGSWRWFSDDELHFRPKEYWPAHTKVVLNADLAGVKAAPGLWGVEDRKIKFTIGKKQTSVVNTKKHTMAIKVNDKVVKRMPVSTGSAKYPTKSGIHVVMGKADPYEMDSTTAGITGSDAYLTTVRYAVRISNSGEFVHAAPWSASSQGRRNVSHGCVNVTTERALWFYNFSQVGDIVDVVGTDVQIEPTNGFGDWNLSWEEWQKGSALD
ncbi:MAG: L,D-transpeptidase family protein [Streptosporangiales bacterium]|nr:L,D-transpeptidase family protein [Streptosporangiales bacterium]